MESRDGETRRIWIVDDDPAMRGVLAAMLRPTQADIEMYSSGENFLAATDGRSPGCVLLDMKLPGLDGISVYHELRRRGATVPVIFLTGYADVATARQVLILGASDFLQKPVDRRSLVESVQEAFDKDRRARERFQLSERLAQLTRREWEVMRLVVAGEPNKLISAELEISQKTVEAHRARVMAKTQANSLADLVRMYGAFEASENRVSENRAR